MRYLAIILLLSSCSAQYHLNKAIKKGYKCEDSVQIDTIRITTLDSIPVIINDTIVWEKIINTKDTIIEWKTKNVYIPKTRQDKRIEYRLKAKTIYKDRIVEKAEAKAKTPKTNGNLNLLFVGVAIGLLLSYLFKFAKDKYLF